MCAKTQETCLVRKWYDEEESEVSPHWYSTFGRGTADASEVGSDDGDGDND